jgi:hypothetical protein
LPCPLDQAGLHGEFILKNMPLNRDYPLERKVVIPAKWGKQVGYKVTTRKAGIQLIKERPRSGSIPLFCRLRRVFYLADFPPQPALEWGNRGRERRTNG